MPHVQKDLENTGAGTFASASIDSSNGKTFEMLVGRRLAPP
jgi:hypothetical protein